jgi:hypothetical protein
MDKVKMLTINMLDTPAYKRRQKKEPSFDQSVKKKKLGKDGVYFHGRVISFLSALFIIIALWLIISVAINNAHAAAKSAFTFHYRIGKGFVRERKLPYMVLP